MIEVHPVIRFFIFHLLIFLLKLIRVAIALIDRLELKGKPLESNTSRLGDISTTSNRL